MLGGRITLVVVSRGGAGSAMLSGLLYLHRALLTTSHPTALRVYAVDGDRVTSTNLRLASTLGLFGAFDGAF
jgi:hypothetical protein